MWGSSNNEQVPNTRAQKRHLQNLDRKRGETNEKKKKKAVINLIFFICQWGTSVTVSLPTWKGKRETHRTVSLITPLPFLPSASSVRREKTDQGNSLSLMYSDVPDFITPEEHNSSFGTVSTYWRFLYSMIHSADSKNIYAACMERLRLYVIFCVCGAEG